MWSLRQRLTRQTLAAVLSIIALLGLSAYLAMNQASEKYFQTRLEHDADLLAGALRFDRSTPYLAEGVDQPIFREALSGHYYHIDIETTGSTKVTLHSLSLAGHTLPVATTHGDEHFQWFDFLHDQQLYMLIRHFDQTHNNSQDTAITIYVAEDFAPIQRAFSLAFGLLLLGVIGLVLIWAVLQQAMIRRNLKPFEYIELQLQQLNQQQREKLDAPSMLELQPLVHEINRLGIRNQERLQRARLAAGNLSHSLKAPLTLLTHRLDGSVDGLGKQERLECQQQIQRMREMIERELKRARIAGLMSQGQALDMVELLEQLKQSFAKLYPQRVITINAATPLEFPGDREDMMELCGNLLDNACKWASKEVLITLNLFQRDDTRYLEIDIEDDGAGVPAESLSSLQHPGVRLDESVSGHGLGLSIVADIIGQYEGHCEFGPGKNGGLKVSVQLPYPEPP